MKAMESWKVVNLLGGRECPRGELPMPRSSTSGTLLSQAGHECLACLQGVGERARNVDRIRGSFHQLGFPELYVQ